MSFGVSTGSTSGGKSRSYWKPERLTSEELENFSWLVRAGETLLGVFSSFVLNNRKACRCSRSLNDCLLPGDVQYVISHRNSTNGGHCQLFAASHEDNSSTRRHRESVSVIDVRGKSRRTRLKLT